jgi:hypothetical protein
MLAREALRLEEIMGERNRREQIHQAALVEFLRRRDALFREMTLDKATEFLQDRKLFLGEEPEELIDPLTPLAAAHKARLQWLDATDAMLAESIEWLKEHGYENTTHGLAPMTPEDRDAQRAILGKPPLRLH